MKRLRARRASALAGSIVLGVVLVVSASGAPSSGSAGGRPGGPDTRIGTPWIGALGLQRTTAEIMATQQVRGHRPARTLPERDVDFDKRPNPNSPKATDARIGAALAGPKLSVGTSFTGATLAESGAVPPDSMGAVGPSQFLVGVNGRIKIFSKAGVVGTLNADLDVFFAAVISSGTGTFTTDPRVRYDALSGKWFVLAIDATPPSFINNRVLLAVSDDETIDGGTVWTFFQFQQNLASPAGDTDTLADFPTLGIDANALYVGANMFDSSGDFSNTSAFVIRKSSVTGAGPIVVTAFRDLIDGSNGQAGPWTPQGVDNADAAATQGYLVGVDFDFFGRLDIRRVSTPGGTPTLSGNLAISVPSTFFPINPTVSGSSKPLDGIDDRLGSSSIRGGKLYTSHAIGVNSSGVATASPDRDATRWYELSNLTSTPTLSRSGTIFDSGGKSFWMPSIAVSPQGHAVVGMSSGGPSARPDGAVSSMLATESAFSTPTNYTASSANYNVNTGGSTYRWGDYSHTSIDPCDGQTFWTIQEYVESLDNWGVKVGKAPAPPPATPASISPSSVPVGQSSATVTLTGTSSSGSGFWDPGAGTCHVRIGTAISGGVVVHSVSFTDATHLTLDVDTTAATAGTKTITITNPDGQTSNASIFTLTTPPSNDSLPTITGTAAVGSVLTGSDGTWSGSPTPTLTRKWRRCDTGGNNCADIGGATATTYTLVQPDAGSTIRLQVTGTSSSGTTVADSAATVVVTGPPVNTVLPAITGTASRGQLLTASTGTWTGYPAPTFTYQWRRCDSGGASCADIGTATSSTYTPVTADEGSTLRVVVTATNTSGTPSATSSATAQVTGSPVNTALPAVAGTVAKGSTLTASNGTWSGFPASFTYTYGWSRCDDGGGAGCVAIGGATASSYELVQADVGHTIKARVTASNGVAPSGTADSALTGFVSGPPSNTVAPTVTGTTGIGDTLTAGDGTWSGYPAPTFTYQWKQCDSDGDDCAAIVGQTAGTHVVASADAGYRLRVTVTGTNASGSASADSATTDVTGAPVSLAPPAITGTAQVGSTLTADKGSWTGVPTPTFTYQWRRCDTTGVTCADIGAATASTYAPVSADVDSKLRVRVSASNTGGGAAPVDSALTAAVVAAPSGGGGGGGGPAPDVVVTLAAAPASPKIGDTLMYELTARNLAGAASSVVATINLPAQVTFGSATADRGAGCTGTTTVTCNLDFLGGSLVATVRVVTTVRAAGSLVATASLTSTPADGNTANNTASVTTVVTAPIFTPPFNPAPVVKWVGTRALTGTRRGSTEFVTALFSVSEAVQLQMSVTRLGATKKLTLLKGSRLAAATAASRRLVLAGRVTRAGTFSLRPLLARTALVKGKTYVIRLTATDAGGKRTTLTIRFRA